MQKVGWALAQEAGNLVLGIEGRMLGAEGAGLTGPEQWFNEGALYRS